MNILWNFLLKAFKYTYPKLKSRAKQLPLSWKKFTAQNMPGFEWPVCSCICAESTILSLYTKRRVNENQNSGIFYQWPIWKFQKILFKHRGYQFILVAELQFYGKRIHLQLSIKFAEQSLRTKPSNSEEYSENCRTAKMKYFSKIVKGLYLFLRY